MFTVHSVKFSIESRGSQTMCRDPKVNSDNKFDDEWPTIIKKKF